MKKVLIYCLVFAFISCEKEEMAYVSSPEEAETEYQDLPELIKLENDSAVNKSTNYKIIDGNILYDQKVILRQFHPLYGVGNILCGERSNGDIVVVAFLLKNSIHMSNMRYNYTITSMKIDTDREIVYLKGERPDKSKVFLKYVFKTSHEYVYKY